MEVAKLYRPQYRSCCGESHSWPKSWQGSQSMPTGCSQILSEFEEEQRTYYCSMWKAVTFPQAKRWLPDMLGINTGDGEENSRAARSHSSCPDHWQEDISPNTHLVRFWCHGFTTSCPGHLGELTDALSAEKHITISAVHPLLTHLSQEILKEEDTDSSLTAQMKRVVRVDLEGRYGDPQLSIHLNVWLTLIPGLSKQSLIHVWLNTYEKKCYWLFRLDHYHCLPKTKVSNGSTCSQEERRVL